MKYSKLKFNWSFDKQDRDSVSFPEGKDDLGAFIVFSELEKPFRLRKLKGVKHIFIETPELFEFLRNTAKKDISFTDYVSSSDFRDFNQAEYNETKEDQELYPYDPDNDERRADLVFHHQVSDLSFCVSISFYKNDSKAFNVMVTDGYKRKSFNGHSLSDEENQSFDGEYGALISQGRELFKQACPNSDFEDIFSPELWSDPMSQMARVGLNYLLYSSCFPERVIDGLPKGIEASMYTGKNNAKRLTPAPQLFKKGSTPIKPHFCSGYFKTFRDERFTRMKGKTIFVKAYMVGGVAKTAIGEDDEQD